MEALSHTFLMGLEGALVVLSLAVAVRAVWLRRRMERAHAELAASRSDLAAAQRIGEMGSWRWDVRTNALVWSDQVYRIFGRDGGTAPSYEDYLASVHPDDHERVVRAIRRALFERAPYRFRHRIVRPDGETRTLEAQGEVEFGRAGEPLRMIGTCQDITQSVRLQERLEEQSRELRGVLDSMFTFVAVFSTEGVLIDVNRALTDGFGLNRNDVIGAALWDTHPWSYSRETQAQAHDVISRAARGEVVRGDFILRVGRDTLMTVDAVFGPLKDSAGRIVQVIGSGVDVTARQRAEQAVKASEARLRTILESEPECVKVLDRECRLLDMNAAGLKMVGAASLDAVRGASVLELVDPYYHAAFVESVERVFRGETTRLQFEIVSSDGTRRWMDQHAAPLFDPAQPGKVCEMIAVTRDVTERIAMEQSSRKIRELLEQAQHIANIGSWEWDFTTGEVSWSAQCFRIVGWEPNSVEPTLERFLSRVHPDDRGRLEAAMAAAIERGAPCDLDHRIVLPSGETRIVRQLGETKRDPDGRPARMIGTTQDVSVLRSIEADLRQSRATLFDILTISPEGVIVTDAEGRITLFSVGAEAIFGFAAHEVVGREIDCLMPERFRAAHRGHLRAFAASGQTSRRMGGRAEIVGLRKSGEEFEAQASLSKLETPGGPVFTTILRDVTQEKATQTELLEAKLKAETANRVKSQFVANMSHELRTPLNAIIGFSEILGSDDLWFSEERRREYAQDIHSSGKHLLAVINDILDISRIEAGKVTLVDEALALGELIDTVVRMVRPRAEETGVTVTCGGLPDAVELVADRRLVLQALLNLASNAVKFTERGGRVDIRADVTASGGIAIAVSDTGIGMSAEDVARVGEPFLQVDGRLARKFEGTGLGLVISKRLIELHGGTLSIESELGRGTTMTIILPASRTAGERGGMLVAAAS